MVVGAAFLLNRHTTLSSIEAGGFEFLRGFRFVAHPLIVLASALIASRVRFFKFYAGIFF